MYYQNKNLNMIVLSQASWGPARNNKARFCITRCTKKHLHSEMKSWDPCGEDSAQKLLVITAPLQHSGSPMGPTAQTTEELQFSTLSLLLGIGKGKGRTSSRNFYMQVTNSVLYMQCFMLSGIMHLNWLIKILEKGGCLAIITNLACFMFLAIC